MSTYWDTKRDKRLISFLYNSNFFTGMIFNDNLELIFNPTNNNNPFIYIDNRINSVGLNEMANDVDNIINFSLITPKNTYQINANGLLMRIIVHISARPIYNTVPLTQSNTADILIKELEHYFHKNTLRDDDFDWISIDNPRLVNFVWASLRNSSFNPNKSNITINYDLDTSHNSKIGNLRPNQYITPYKAMNLEMNPPDLNGKLESIKLFFDSWGEPLINQKNLMTSIKTKWNLVKNKTEIINWLNKNEEITEWSWSYIHENLLNKTTPEWVNISETDKKGIEHQIKDTIITLYDLLDRETERKLLKSQLSKNGAQQKYRKKEKVNTKVLNICISIETKEKLNRLKKSKRCSIKEIIENLIEDEIKRQEH